MKNTRTCKECHYYNINVCGHESADAAYSVKTGVQGTAPEINAAEGTPEWCPYLIKNKIYRVSSELATYIIDTRKPLGSFYCKGNGYFVGIDNLTGDAWTEEFKSMSACVRWLKRKDD